MPKVETKYLKNPATVGELPIGTLLRYNQGIYQKIWNPRSDEVKLLSLTTGETWSFAPSTLVEVLPIGTVVTLEQV